MKHGSLVALIQLKTKQIIDPSFPITREGRLDLGSREHILILELAFTLILYLDSLEDEEEGPTGLKLSIEKPDCGS